MFLYPNIPNLLSPGTHSTLWTGEVIANPASPRVAELALTRIRALRRNKYQSPATSRVKGLANCIIHHIYCQLFVNRNQGLFILSSFPPLPSFPRFRHSPPLRHSRLPSFPPSVTAALRQSRPPSFPPSVIPAHPSFSPSVHSRASVIPAPPSFPPSVIPPSVIPSLPSFPPLSFPPLSFPPLRHSRPSGIPVKTGIHYPLPYDKLPAARL